MTAPSLCMSDVSPKTSRGTELEVAPPLRADCLPVVATSRNMSDACPVRSGEPNFKFNATKTKTPLRYPWQA